MRMLGLEELTFSEVYDQERSEEGKKLAKIGKYLSLLICCREDLEGEGSLGIAG